MIAPKAKSQLVEVIVLIILGDLYLFLFEFVIGLGEL